MYGYCRSLLIRYVNGLEQHYYGVDMVQVDTLEVIASAPALTQNWAHISRYVRDMNELDLMPEHFWDVVDDIQTAG